MLGFASSWQLTQPFKMTSVDLMCGTQQPTLCTCYRSMASIQSGIEIWYKYGQVTDSITTSMMLMHLVNFAEPVHEAAVANASHYQYNLGINVSAGQFCQHEIEAAADVSER